MRRQGYLFRQLLWLAAAVFVPLLALLAYNVQQDAAYARRAAFQALENYAAGVAQDAESLLAATDTYLAFMAERPLVMALNPRRCDPLLDGVVQRRQHFANVFVTDLAGRPICSAIQGPGTAPDSFATYAWHAAAANSPSTVLSKPFLAPVAQRMVSAMSRPVRDAAQRRVGTLTVLLDLESLQREWNRYALPPGSRLTIFDREGTVMVTRPDFAALVGHDASAILKTAVGSNPSGAGVAFGVDGVERAFALRPVQAGGWQAGAAIPVDHVFAEYHAHARRSAALAAIVVLGVLGAAVLMARRLSEPLAALAMTARLVAQGNLQLRAVESFPGEFGQVAREFNAMLDARQLAAAELKESERRHAERLNRHADFYTALSRTNGAIVRMSDPQPLYQEICRICVEHGHASIAYISLVEGRVIKPVAWSGPAQGFLQDFVVPLDADVPEGRGLTAQAALTGLRQVANSYEDDPRTLPWRQRAREIGTLAAATFPFRRGGQTIGTLSLHMTVSGFFDDRLIALVEEMTGDVSFALDNFDRERAREAAEHQARSDAQRFRTLFQTAPVAMSIVAVADQRLLDVNEAFQQFTGQSRQELIGRNAFEEGLWPGEQERADFVREFGASGRVRNFEMRGTDAAGRRRDYLLQADRVDFAEQPCVLTIANDVTELRDAQRTLHDRERQLSGLVETAMDAIISIDASHRVRLFNRAATELFQVAAADAIGSEVQRFIPDRFHGRHLDHVQAFARTGGTARKMGGLHTLVGLKADGTEFPLEASISKLGQGESLLMTVVIRDATEMQRAAQARLSQDAAESASRAKTEFLSRMSHELRTPLNAVIGFSQLLQSDTRDALSPAQQVQVEHIRRAGWHLLALVNDVLDVSKIEAGRVDVETSGVDLIDLLDEVVRISAAPAAQQQVSVATAYRSGEAVWVRADPRRLRQVLINLLSNAIKYNRSGGSVAVGVSRDAAGTHIDVDDTGLGMNAQQMAHLYEPFNRLGREAAPIEGTGLGLALTRQLVLLMHGQIRITSEPGVGTRVRVTMPSQEATSASSAPLPRTPQPLKPQPAAANGEADPSGVVLYIEDNPVNLLLVEELLLRWPGVLLVHAATGTEGIALALSTAPDLILLDMRLPDMDGVKVLETLRASAGFGNCPVVALSASAMPDEVSAARSAGASDYWTKPLDFEHFLREMQRLLSPQT